jgi:hypothetical protein
MHGKTTVPGSRGSVLADSLISGVEKIRAQASGCEVCSHPVGPPIWTGPGPAVAGNPYYAATVPSGTDANEAERIRQRVERERAAIFAERDRAIQDILKNGSPEEAEQVRAAQERIIRAQAALEAEQRAAGKTKSCGCSVCSLSACDTAAPRPGAHFAMAERFVGPRVPSELREPTPAEFAQYTTPEGKDRFAIVMQYFTNAYQAPEILEAARAHLIVLEPDNAPNGTDGPGYFAEYIYNAPRHVIAQRSPNPQDDPRPPPGSWCFPVRQMDYPDADRRTRGEAFPTGTAVMFPPPKPSDPS